MLVKCHRWATSTTTLSCLLGILKPPPDLTISEWSDQFAVLRSETSADPGRWRSYPYQRAIMDAFCHPLIERVTLMKSKQIGYTKMMGNIIGYHIHLDPCSILVVQPTIEDAEKWSKEDLQPMFESANVLRGIVAEAKSRASGNTITTKHYPGGIIYIVGANSARGFRRITVRIVLFDEVDGYPQTAGQEGDQIDLGTGRTEKFWNRKIAIGSTPTLSGLSRVEEHFNKSSPGYFVLSCPECGGEHVRGFKCEEIPDEHIIIRGGDMPISHLTWPDNDPKKAAWVCPQCACLLDQENHDKIMQGGYWKGDHWEHRDNEFTFFDGFDGHIGFKIWAGYSYSPNATPERIVKDYLERQDDDDRLKTFVNTVLGRTWEERGETIESHSLFKRREDYVFECPEGVEVITAGVDIQGDRIEAEIIGWSLTSNEEGWSIDHVILPGDPTREEVWKDLSQLLKNGYKNKEGKKVNISGVCIDSGYMTSHVYKFVKDFKSNFVWSIKGMAGEGRPIVQPIISRLKRLRKRRNSPVEIIGVDEAKHQLYKRLGIQTPGPGFMHFPMERDKGYFDQLTAEKLVIRKKRGRPVKDWVLLRPRNEVLDCWIYGLAALRLLLLDTDKFNVKQLNRQNEVGKPQMSNLKPIILSNDPWLSI